MDFPEVIFGSRSSLESATRIIKQIMRRDRKMACSAMHLSHELRKTYLVLEPYFIKYTESICRQCEHPCCVNRHGFPDFEDLIILCAMGEHVHGFDFSAKDTGLCQFLGKNGCVLERCCRSYRCTWYFCDEVFDRFEARDKAAFDRFTSFIQRLARQRAEIVMLFKSAWDPEQGE